MIVTVAMLKGGSGKTTTAEQLIAALHGRGIPVAGVDADAQGTLMSRAESAGESWPVVVAAPTVALGDRVARLSQGGTHVVIDTPNDPRAGQKIVTAACRVADRVVVPVTPSPREFLRIRATLDLIADVDTPALLLLSRTRTGTKSASQGRELLEKIAGDYDNAGVMDATVPLREDIAQAFGPDPAHPAYEHVTAELFNLPATEEIS